MTARPWWQSGAIYQLLVPSFLDTDSDGLGDLEGVIARLDYLEWLGANAIWLSPCYPSPLKELGYDVEFYLWIGMFAPKGTPAAVITTLREASKKAAADEKFKQAMTNLGQDVAYLDQPEFKAFWDADAQRVEDAVHSIGKIEG